MKTYMLLCCIVTLGLLSSCKKEGENTNEDIVKQAGVYNIEKWSFYTYDSGGITPTLVSSETNVGSFELKDVNFGAVSEGFLTKNKDIASPIFENSSPQPCYESFRWNCDNHRFSFFVNWCNGTLYDYTLEGFGKRNQTWFRLTTDTDGYATTKEVFEVKKVD